ncbi:MAG TPA: ribbon-helix-helix protein, CopG family [Vicinamibacteria bacterium]|jgi:hypothetical protein
MRTSITIRLDVETQRIVERIARRRKQSRSQVVRDAITALAEKERPSGRTPYDTIAHLVGIVQGGPSDLSESTGEKFTKLLRDRKRRRR